MHILQLCYAGWTRHHGSGHSSYMDEHRSYQQIIQNQDSGCLAFSSYTRISKNSKHRFRWEVDVKVRHHCAHEFCSIWDTKMPKTALMFENKCRQVQVIRAYIYIYIFIYIYIHCICTWISVCKRSAYLCAYSPYLGVDPSVLCVMLWYKEATMDVDIWRSLSQMIHLWKMCTRTGLVSYVKCSGLPTALHSFNSCECLIQVLFSVPPEPQLVAFILRGIRAVWMVSLANVTQAVAVWHFTTLSVLYWEWLRPTVLSQSQKWSKFCGLSPDHHSPPRTSQNLNPLEVSRSPQLICRADLAMDELLRFWIHKKNTPSRIEHGRENLVCLFWGRCHFS